MHRKAEDELTEQDGLFILNLLNYDMADQFAALGVNTAGGEFVFVEEEEVSIIQKAELLIKAHDTFRLPIADDYLYETLKIEKPVDYDRMKAEQSKQKEEDHFRDVTKMMTPQNKSGFFAHAPQGDGALEW